MKKFLVIVFIFCLAILTMSACEEFASTALTMLALTEPGPASAPAVTENVSITLEPAAMAPETCMTGGCTVAAAAAMVNIAV